MTNETELMPCPFCGGKAEHLECEETDNMGGQVIGCKECHASTKVFFGNCVGLLDAWNTRAVPEGYAIVPLEPTEEMVNEYFDATRITLEGGASGTLAVIEGYKAMIAAAQKGGE